MGGAGSGQIWRSSKETVEGYFGLDIRRWARAGLLQPGASFDWHWNHNGRCVAGVQVQVEGQRIWLSRSRVGAACNSHTTPYPVALLTTPCHFGGRRIWFACPARYCGRRVALLYGGSVFVCRHCRQLVYASQRESNLTRGLKRADAIRDRLGWHIAANEIARTKPKGMQRRTFERLIADLEIQENRANQALAAYCLRGVV